MAAPVPIDDPSVEGARRGDPTAWADLYERFHPCIRRYLEVVAPGLDPESVWEAAATSLDDEPVGVAPLVWLLRTADRQPEPGSTREDREVDDSVRLMRRLPSSQRRVLSLRVVGGLTDAETASVIGGTPTRVAASAHAAVQELTRLVDA